MRLSVAAVAMGWILDFGVLLLDGLAIVSLTYCDCFSSDRVVAFFTALINVVCARK
jgi:hypothetical protein